MERRARGPNGTIRRLKSYTETMSILLVDIFTLFLAYNLSVLIRRDLLPVFWTGLVETLPFKGLGSNSVWIFALWIFLFYYEGLYTTRFSFWDEIKAMWRASFFSTVGIFTIISLGKLSEEISRSIIILMGVLTIAILPVLRTSAKRLLRGLGLLKRRVLILGAGQTGRLILKALRREPNYGYDVVGFLDDDPGKIGSKIDGVKVHKGVDRAGNYLKSCNITDIFIAMPGAGRERLQELINSLQHEVDRIVFVPDMFGMAVVGTSLQHFFHEQAFAIEVRNNLARPLNVFIKRCFDFTVGGLIFIFLLPLTALISLLVRLDSNGPAIFTQKRVGKNGKAFMCYKFRTMSLDAEEKLNDLLSRDELSRNEWQMHWKLREDPRVTRIGKLLRKTSLDELPQLINVMKGEMSLVGPRPYLPSEAEILGKDIDLCLDVLPGITGLWQVSGRSSTSYKYRNALDSWYVRNWNLWLDVVILLKTIRVVIGRQGAF